MPVLTRILEAVKHLELPAPTRLRLNHYSDVPLKVVDPAMRGTRLRTGLERTMGGMEKSYFYKEGSPPNKFFEGSIRHDTGPVDMRLYDTHTDPLHLGPKLTAEKVTWTEGEAVLRRLGYDGYTDSKDFPNVVVAFKKLPVRARLTEYKESIRWDPARRVEPEAWPDGAPKPRGFVARTPAIHEGKGAKRAYFAIDSDGEVINVSAKDPVVMEEMAYKAAREGATRVRALDGSMAEAFHKAGFKAYKTEAFEPRLWPHTPRKSPTQADIVFMEYRGPNVRNRIRKLWNTFGLYAHPGFDTLARADDDLRRYVGLGLVDKTLAKSEPRIAKAEGVQKVKGLVKKLADDGKIRDIDALVRTQTDYPITPGQAVRWARSKSELPLDQAVRHGNGKLTMLGGFLPGSALLASAMFDEDTESRAGKLLLAAGFIGVPIATVEGGAAALGAAAKATATHYKFPAGTLKNVKAIRARFRPDPEGRVTLEFDPPLSGKALPPEQVVPAGAELAARQGQPGQPKEVLEAFNTPALLEHIKLRVAAINDWRHLENAANKYLPYSRMLGHENHTIILDSFAEQAARFAPDHTRLDRFIQGLNTHRTKLVAEETKKVLRLLDEGEGGMAWFHKAGFRVPEGAEGEAEVAKILDRLLTRGIVRRVEDLRAGPPTIGRYFMHFYETAAFDQRLQTLAALGDVRESVYGNYLSFFTQRSNEILRTVVTEGERAALHYVMQGKPLPASGRVHWGDLAPRIRELKMGAPSETWEAVFEHNGRTFAVYDPNMLITATITPAVEKAAQRLRQEVFDPLAIKAMGNELAAGHLLEWYWPRYYSRQTFRDMGKEGLIDANKVDFINSLDDAALSPHEFHPGREVIFRALLARKLPDLALYAKDPHLVARLYIQGAVKRIAYEPLTEAWNAIKRSEMVKGSTTERAWDNGWRSAKGLNDSTVGTIVDDWLGDLLGIRISKTDRALLEFLKGEKMQDVGGWLSSQKHAGLQALGAWIAEPGARPAAKFASYAKGLQFMRKLGLNPGTVMLNMTQPLVNNYSQSHARDYTKLWDPKVRDELYTLFKASGAIHDQAKFEGSEGLWTHLLGTNGLGNPIVEGRVGMGRLGRAMELGEAGSGWLFRQSEKWNNFQGFAIAALEAQQGRIYQTGRGFVQGQRFTQPEDLNLVGLFSARRTHFGGRVNRAPVFRDPLSGLIFQFNTFNFRQTGLLGAQIRQAQKSAVRMNKMYKAGDVKGAAEEFANNVMAPVKTLMYLGATASLMSALGLAAFDSELDRTQTFGRIFGFLPMLDGRALSQGKVRVMDAIELGPTLSFPAELIIGINNIATSYKTKPELRALRISELLLSFLPIAEVEAKRIARSFLDPRLTDSDRKAILLGYKTDPLHTWDNFFTLPFVPPSIRDIEAAKGAPPPRRPYFIPGA